MAIQQHPLPQDISSYRFRLIGDMTLKQFASLGICIVLAIIGYSLPLPFFFKYPLVLLFLLLGVGMAFVPVQGRSLDVWLIAFIKSIYSPTQYTWKRSSTTTESTETAVPSKENDISTTRPVSNPTIQITQSAAPPVPQPTPAPTEPTPTITSPTLPTSPSPTVSTPENIIPAPLKAPETPSVVPLTPPQPSPVTPAPVSLPPTSAPTTNLPIPFTPSTPNTLVGLTLSPAGNILDSVMVEIKRDNLTLRATRSNKLGQFMFARPLDSGLYQILAEKDGFTFSPYSIELTGNIVKPLKIQAQN